MECLTRDIEKARLMLIAVGISPSKKGFNYLADSIVEFSHGYKSLREVYERISDKHSVSPGNLDRCMRTCIGGLSATDTCDRINKMARFNIVDSKTLLTCGNFIALMSEFLRYDSMLKF